ncbi:Acyl-CoA Delta(11) desaturase [Halotydeus destructor]|nr:Acyl-CoA Delta(11) desaturase [Halotydeus destructor]
MTVFRNSSSAMTVETVASHCAMDHEDDQYLASVGHTDRGPPPKPYQWQINYFQVVAHTVLHSAAVAGAIYIIATLNLKLFLLTYVTSTLSLIGMSAGAHRLWSHKAGHVTTGFITNTQRPDADPHNARRGFFFAHIGWLLSYEHHEVTAKEKNVDLSDLLADPVVKYHKMFFLPLYIAILWFLPTYMSMTMLAVPLGPALLVTCLRFVYVLHCTFLINSVAHLSGDHPYDNNINPGEIYNFAPLMSHGEAYHNFHHTFPQDYRASEFGWMKGHWNLSAMFIEETVERHNMNVKILQLLSLCALIGCVSNQNIVGALGSIVTALKQFGILSFVEHPDLLLNYNNLEGPRAFVFNQILSQIPQFLNNTLRDCLDTAVSSVPFSGEKRTITYSRLIPKGKAYEVKNDVPLIVDRDKDGCPGITRIFSKHGCLGDPTFPSDPSKADSTKLFFIDKNGKDLQVSYVDFVKDKELRTSVIERSFDARRTTNILIHGWTDFYYRDGWMWSFKEFILKTAKPRPNMLIIDWRQWSQSFAISKIKMNSMTGKVSKAFRLKPSTIYIYGHSYGGQIAGYGAGKFKSLMQNANRRPGEKQIASIVALDPSDQCFGRGSFQNAEPVLGTKAYLDASAAHEVKVIHTDANAFGAYERLGDVDIYVNQGSGQPDCPVDASGLDNVDAFAYLLACSHYRATRILTQAYYSQDGGNCQPVAFRCSSFDDFLNGICACLFTDRNDATSLVIGSSGSCRQQASQRYELWPDGDRYNFGSKLDFSYSVSHITRDSWFLTMSSEPPYCLRSSEIPNNVEISLRLDGIKPDGFQDLSSKKQGVITLNPKDVGMYKKVSLTFVDEPGLVLGSQRKFKFQTISLFYMSHIDYCARSQYSKVYCAYNGDFGDTSTSPPDFIPESPINTVQFTNDRCLDIIEYCVRDEKTSSQASLDDCKAFIVLFLKDFLLSMHDQSCTKNETLCAQVVACLYETAEYRITAGAKHATLLKLLSDFNFDELAKYLLSVSEEKPCAALAADYDKRVKEDGCSIALLNKRQKNKPAEIFST